MIAAAKLLRTLQTQRQALLRVTAACLLGLLLAALTGCHRDRQAMAYAPAPAYAVAQPVQVPAPAPAYATAQPVPPTEPVYQNQQPAPDQGAYYDPGQYAQPQYVQPQYAQPTVVYAAPTVITQEVPVYVTQPVPYYVENTIVRDRVIVNDRNDRDRRDRDDRRETTWTRNAPAPHQPAPVARKPEPVKKTPPTWTNDRRTTTPPPVLVTKKPDPIKPVALPRNDDRRTTAGNAGTIKKADLVRQAPPARVSEPVTVKAVRDNTPPRITATNTPVAKDLRDKKTRDRQ
ncbi:MAG: hypothetical protein NTV86_23930 [Planctomycetota bacterium]|nr:hypothetical protein [Planctomycetota bacterium]